MTRKHVTEMLARTFVQSFTDILFEMVTVDGELYLFDNFYFQVSDKIGYVKTNSNTLELVRRAVHTVDLSVTTSRTAFSESVRAYDQIVCEATALALRSVNSISGSEEPVGFTELSREAVLQSLPEPIDILRTEGEVQTAYMREKVSNKSPIYTLGCLAVRKKYHSLQHKLQLSPEEVLSWMQCVTEGIIAFLAKYSECELGIMGKLYSYHQQPVEIRIRSCTLPIALPRGILIRWIPSSKLVGDARYRSKHGLRRRIESKTTEEEKIWNGLKQLLIKLDTRVTEEADGDVVDKIGEDYGKRDDRYDNNEWEEVSDRDV